jgi:signal transduction histidine kinase
MNTAWRPPAAVVPIAATLAVLSVATTATLVALNHASIHSFDAADPVELVMPVTFAFIGGLIARRRPENLIGWLFLFMAVVIGLSGTASQYARYAAITHPGGLPLAAWALWFYSWSPSLVYPAGAATLTFLHMPSGRLPSRRWRVVGGAGLVITVLLVVSTALIPGPNSGPDGRPALDNPAGLRFLAPVAQTPFPAALYFAALAVALVAAASLIVRMRRSTSQERQQLKWIAFAVVVAVIANGLLTAAYFAFPDSPVFHGNVALDAVLVAGFAVALPAATGVAILKHNLYEIDVVISRTLVYGSLAVLITGVYVGIAVGIGELVGSGGKPNLGLSILATAIVAIGFQPARERLQRVANRLVYGLRATPYQVLSEFSSQVAGSYAADEVLPRMARLLEEGTGADVVRVWLRREGQLYVAAAWPLEDSPPLPVAMRDGALPAMPAVTRAVEVRHQGELLGALSVEKRRGESLTPVEEKLLDDLAHQAGLVLKNVGLTADLQRRLEELRASRQRLVSAQDAERRRLERNLHDGAQQHLIALKVKLGLAELLAAKDPEKARATLQQLKSDTDEALETLRDLARGIYPPLLAEKGLVTALESQARKATVPVTVEADGIGRYSQEVEATVYFCVLEALQNVQKYARASRVLVRLSGTDGGLLFDVEDDGRGFDVAHLQRGAGLTNMKDRLDALDGALDVQSRPGEGCRVTGRLPVAPAGDVAAPAAMTAIVS